MADARVFVTGIGILTPLGRGAKEHERALEKNLTGIGPLTLFTPSAGNVYPAGEVRDFPRGEFPRTHELALDAARNALEGIHAVPDAIIIGTTTGGMPLTEELLKGGDDEPAHYRHHSTSSVAEHLAASLRCTGPVITVATACSSGAVAITLATGLLRSGKARMVLAGGADALCRLTYYGFNALQLIDPAGSRPFDRSRKGMTVSEGAAMLVLVAADSPPDGALMEIAGCGLSCDAHHPAAPHPEGSGARAAMSAALADAGIGPDGIHYINCHGTGTIDNDLAEARAIRDLFGGSVPPLSSVKGATGHSLAAAGAIEAALCALAMKNGIIPANAGCAEPDPALSLEPVRTPIRKNIATVLSNSFGFGGNNACLALAAPAGQRREHAPKPGRFEILGCSCVTGAGGTEATMAALRENRSCGGVLPLADILTRIPPREARRLKRLPRIILAIALEARDAAPDATGALSICAGTGWGPLSETLDFLTKLYESGEQFTSPTDFVGSVHNAPAGQAAIALGATGANITATGGDYSFEQALLAASLAAAEGEILIVMGADEHHEKLSPLFDASVRSGDAPADGGGALTLKATAASAGPQVAPVFFGNASGGTAAVKDLIASLGGAERVRGDFAAIMAGMPAAERALCDDQVRTLGALTGFGGPVIDYRAITGQYASASAAAAALAARFVLDGVIPAILPDVPETRLGGGGILLLGLGRFITAVEILP